MKIKKENVLKNSRILIEQAESLSGEVFDSVDPGLYVASENPLRRAARAIKGDRINPVTKKMKVSPGAELSITAFNKFFKTVGIDLQTIESAENSIEDLFVKTYNQISTKHGDVVGHLRTLGEKLSVLGLYGENVFSDREFVVFNFTDAKEIVGRETTAQHDEAAGSLTLPVKNRVQLPIRESSVLDTSNGISGNNFDRSRLRNGITSLLHDGREETWFEYERVGTRTFEEPLNLSIKLELGKSDIVNQLEISVVNLGFREYPRIKDIKIENNNKSQSISGEVLEEDLDLTPRYPNFDKVNTIRFIPRQATAVVLEFCSGESTEAANGRLIRQAIGVQEVRVFKTEYADVGKFLLSTKLMEKEVISASVKVQGLFSEELQKNLKLEVSPDSGQTWTEITDLRNNDGQEVITSDPFSSIQLRGELIQEGATEALRQIVSKKDRHLVVQNSPFSAPIILEDRYYDYLEVIEGRLGQQGEGGHRYRIGQVKSGTKVNQVFFLPMSLDPEKINYSILIDGEEWTRVDSFSGADAKEFIYIEGGDLPRIKFGDDTNGAIPPEGADIILDIEVSSKMSAEKRDEDILLHLPMDSTKARESTTVTVYSLDMETFTSFGGPGKKYVNLRSDVDVTQVTSISNDTYDYHAGTAKAFINGATEFSDLGAAPGWSYDRERKRVYLWPVPGENETDTKVEYLGFQKTITDNWKYSNTSNSIMLSKDDVSVRIGSRDIENRMIRRTLQLESVDNVYQAIVKESIIKGSIKGIDLGAEVGISRTLQTEVEYIDGATEFRGLSPDGESLLGLYSVDYTNNTLYLPPYSNIPAEDQGIAPGRIIWEYVSVGVDYPIGRRLVPGRDYTVEGQQSIMKKPAYLDRVKALNERIGQALELNIRYNIKTQEQPQGVEIEKYFSPVLRSIQIIGATISPKISAALGE